MDVLMPQLGETVTEGTISAWHKNVGDTVEADEILLDVETDKVSMEIPSPAKGKLAKILVETGQTVAVGTVLAVVEAEGSSAAAPAPAAAASAAEAKSAAAASSAPTATTSPATASASSATARGGAGTPGGAAASASSASASQPRRTNGGGAPMGRDADQRLSPAVRRLAAEHDLQLREIEGTGRKGRITRRDVIRFLETGPKPAAHGRAPSGTATPAARPDHSGVPAAVAAGTVPFTRIRKLTAEHMVRSKATSPHVLQAIEVDFSGVDRVRKPLREAWRGRRGYSLTYLPFIAHAVCEALGEFPHANGSVDGDSLVLHEHVNLAIAVDLGPEGLVAPVIKSAEALSVAELADAIQSVASRARQGRLKPDDLSGGTYTISNNGSFGTLITAPIINQPQVAILSTDGVRKKPVVIESPDGDMIAIRPIGILAQSFDHRAIDGGYSGAFLDRVKKLLERGQWTVEV